MRIFSSNSTHKVDGKGRVSIPATFRKVLEREEEPGLWLIPRLRGEPAIEGLGNARFEQMADALDAMNPLDEAAIALSHRIVGQARHVIPDDTGRIVLPPDLREVAGIGEQALFVGLGRSFQIWAPETYAGKRAEMDVVARENFGRLPWGGGSAGGAA